MMGELELLHEWLEAVVSGLDAEVDEQARMRVMEGCGRACALHHGSIEQARAVQRDARDIDELLDGLNQLEGFWCGLWVQDGDAIRSVCTACGCPLVGAGLIELSPTFCDCSRGWVKAVFEAVLGRSVEVDLLQAIGRGDPVCEFVVH